MERELPTEDGDKNQMFYKEALKHMVWGLLFLGPHIQGYKT
jgi:hypothetical protein